MSSRGINIILPAQSAKARGLGAEGGEASTNITPNAVHLTITGSRSKRGTLGANTISCRGKDAPKEPETQGSMSSLRPVGIQCKQTMMDYIDNRRNMLGTDMLQGIRGHRRR